MARWLENLTWPEARDAIVAGDTFVIPVGAAAKEHGPHLPLNTDWLLAHALVERASAHTDFVAAPIVGFGYYPAFTAFPGTLTVSDTIFCNTVQAIAGQLIGFGANKLCILNTGVSTTPELRKVVRRIYDGTGTEILLLNIRDLAAAAKRKLNLDMESTHADAMETSLILAIDETAVRTAELDAAGAASRKNAATVFSSALPLDPDDSKSSAYCPSGALGDPADADKETGEAVLAAMGEFIAKRLTQNWD